jgi:hypothetical protein
MRGQADMMRWQAREFSGVWRRRRKSTTVELTTAAFCMNEVPSNCTFNLEVRLSHTRVKNGAIGYRSDMWAPTHQDKNAICRKNTQQPGPWTRTNLYLGHALIPL